MEYKCRRRGGFCLTSDCRFGLVSPRVWSTHLYRQSYSETRWFHDTSVGLQTELFGYPLVPRHICTDGAIRRLDGFTKHLYRLSYIGDPVVSRYISTDWAIRGPGSSTKKTAFVPLRNPGHQSQDISAAVRRTSGSQSMDGAKKKEFVLLRQVSHLCSYSRTSRDLAES